MKHMQRHQSLMLPSVHMWMQISEWMCWALRFCYLLQINHMSVSAAWALFLELRSCREGGRCIFNANKSSEMQQHSLLLAFCLSTVQWLCANIQAASLLRGKLLSDVFLQPQSVFHPLITHHNNHLSGMLILIIHEQVDIMSQRMTWQECIFRICSDLVSFMVHINV